MGVDVAAYAVDVEGAGTVGTAEELFAELEMQQVLGAVGQDQRAVAASPREFVVTVHL